MATLNRQLPNPDTFLCKPWSTFISAAKLHYSDNSLVENRLKELYHNWEGTKLSKEEMHVFGQFPNQEDFCLVVCHVCNQVVKPQGILTHYERRHGSPCPSRGPVVSVKPNVAVSPTPGPTPPLPFRVPRDYPHSRFNKAPLAVYPPKGVRSKTCVSLPVVSLEKMPCLGRAERGTHVRVNCFSSTTSCSSPSSLLPSLTPPAPLRGSQEKLVSGRGLTTPCSTTPLSLVDRRPSPARSPLDKRPSSTPSPLNHRRPSPSPRTPATPSPLDRKQQNGTKTPRPHRRLSGRVFDPNKHCGVQDPESKRSCTRSLTCKTHSLIHRRAVPGRQKEFDILLAEHKGRAKEKDKAGGQRRESQGGSQSTRANDTTPSTLPPHCHNGRTVSTLKLRWANAHRPRVPGSGGAALLSSIPPVPPGSTQDPPVPVWQRAGGDRDGRLSSDEGDPGTPDDPDIDGDRPSCHYSPHHPRPLGCCAFSSRLMGRGHYVFDRRWDRMRLALHCMVEKHVNAQMWRKVPLAAESPLSLGSPPISTPSPSSLTPPPPLSFPPSTNGAFSIGPYSTAFPQDASAAGLFGVRDPSQPVGPVSALGKPRNGTTTKPIRPPGATGGAAKKRRTTLPPSSDTLRGNNSSYQTLTPTPMLRSGVPLLSGRRKTLGHSASEVGVRAEDWYSNPDQTTTTPYPLTKDHPSPLRPTPSPLPPPSPLVYGGGMEGRKRRSPSAYRGGRKPSKVTKAAAGLDGIFRRNNTGLLASGPESPRQSKLHH
ncbi:ataxin-7-like protein 1 isoform X2 [Salvelinus fontinalis]|uniref:ataxin-7-like protein 1 isoform X2 n=1 Tax=Salvelinus fontinalis TaxID=8038 RepID=UPI002485256C|nr:ataxin-7-like protein 1 isoform X2 [Salvelinus fontinalis]